MFLKMSETKKKKKKKKKKKNSTEQYKDLSSSVPRPGVKYGLA